jgi:hypothetical protein
MSAAAQTCVVDVDAHTAESVHLVDNVQLPDAVDDDVDDDDDAVANKRTDTDLVAPPPTTLYSRWGLATFIALAALTFNFYGIGGEFILCVCVCVRLCMCAFSLSINHSPARYF